MSMIFVGFCCNKALNAGFWEAQGPQEACVNSSASTSRVAWAYMACQEVVAKARASAQRVVFLI
ncbi:MAG: Uncharacterised protein [Flavobacteriia bacterium]|nr:MAG: Uncharacterised protein [Flavobacteriia bacterium]